MAPPLCRGARTGLLDGLALGAGPPRILAPWVFGWVATSQSTSFAFGLCAALMVVAFGLILTLQSVGQSRLTAIEAQATAE